MGGGDGLMRIDSGILANKNKPVAVVCLFTLSRRLIADQLGQHKSKYQAETIYE
jgi:hypothetical protein